MRVGRLGLTLALLWTVGCASWEETLRDVVDPLNALVHQQLPEALRHQDLESLAVLHAPGVRDEARALGAELLAPFDVVERGSCRIDTLQLRDGERVADIEATLRLGGTDPRGVRHSNEQRIQLRCERTSGAWRIAAWELQPARVVHAGGARFVESADELGLAFTNRSRGVADRNGKRQVFFMGSGLGLVDLDDDGFEDVLLVGGAELRFFRNDGGRFVDETEVRGLVSPDSGDCRGAWFADLDEDGDQDLFVAMEMAENALYENIDGHFTRVPESVSGLWSSGHTTSTAMADYDGDGDLDLYLVNGQNMAVVDPEPPHKAKNGTANQFFRNQGGLRFEDATEEAGLGDTGWGLAAQTTDYDLDGDVDILVANDVGFDVLYRNRGDGTFEDVAEEAGVWHSSSSMSADVGDVDGDGWPDLLVSGMASNSRWIVTQPGFPMPANSFVATVFRSIVLDYMHQLFHGNRLYLNNGDGSFREVGTETNTQVADWAWAARFLDHDNDADLDIYAVNGFWSGTRPDDL